MLDSLASAEARRLFLDLAPRIPADDPDLERLLREFYGMPLAIELVAYRAAPFHALRDVWEEWQRTGLALATHPDQPEGRYTSVQRSIELSWQSLRLREEGKRLFCMLGLLPGGMAKQHRTALMGEHAHEAMRQLLATGLAFLRHQERLDLLPPIRAFAQGLPETAAIDRESLKSHYLDLGSDLLLRLTDKNDCIFNRLREDFKNVERSMLAGGDLSGRNLSPDSIKALQDEIRLIIGSQEIMTAAGHAKAQARLTRASSDDDATKEKEHQAEILEQEARSVIKAASSRVMRVLAEESRRSSEQDRPAKNSLEQGRSSDTFTVMGDYAPKPACKAASARRGSSLTCGRPGHRPVGPIVCCGAAHRHCPLCPPGRSGTNPSLAALS